MFSIIHLYFSFLFFKNILLIYHSIIKIVNIFI
ncbi:hypothetical protein CoNPh10_CDS0002 [Staphylococcus phage S-CoN_Ph10]|nr:hypothetical protein CoNPh10_CDS0002 [Staphylococcus phage S-CoN_Ph10]